MTLNLSDPATFQRSCLQMIEAEPGRKGFWSILLADSLRGETKDLDREMLAEALHVHFSGGYGKQERPALTFVNAADDQAVQMAFGYFRGEPTAAVFRDSDVAPIMIPREVLQIALDQGWGE